MCTDPKASGTSGIAVCIVVVAGHELDGALDRPHHRIHPATPDSDSLWRNLTFESWFLSADLANPCLGAFPVPSVSIADNTLVNGVEVDEREVMK